MYSQTMEIRRRFPIWGTCEVLRTKISLFRIAINTRWMDFFTSGVRLSGSLVLLSLPAQTWAI